MDTSKVDLSIIIPAYNEARRILPTIERQVRELRGLRYSIIVCDDGSCDNTAALCEAIKERLNLRLMVLKQQHAGRGQALRYALERTSSKYVVFSSADIVLRRFEVEQALSRLRRADLVMFSKWTRKRPRNVARWILSRMFSFLLRVLFHVPFHDTQGVKLAGVHTARQIISACSSSGFFLDAEIAIVAFNRGLRVVEQAWDYSYSPGSTITPFAVFGIAHEMLLMRLRLPPI
jgi:dolichyl-phosphate beta-glucosyltransferase